MTYTPDRWVVIKIKGNDPHYRVLAGWSGGYATGDSWRMNSGITKVTENKKSYLFSGSSKSVYNCRKTAYGFNMISGDIWAQMKSLHKDKVELMDEDTDWMNIDWGINE